MIVYLDTSVILEVLLRQGKPIGVWGEWDAAYSSELSGVEARRVIDRLRLESALDDDGVAEAHVELAHLEASIGRIPVTRPVLRRAGLPLATVVKTLDAIHLSSALLFQERRGTSLDFVTRDAQQGRAARALGFNCIGV